MLGPAAEECITGVAGVLQDRSHRAALPAIGQPVAVLVWPTRRRTPDSVPVQAVGDRPITPAVQVLSEDRTRRTPRRSARGRTSASCTPSIATAATVAMTIRAVSADFRAAHPAQPQRLGACSSRGSRTVELGERSCIDRDPSGCLVVIRLLNHSYEIRYGVVTTAGGAPILPLTR